MRIISDKSRIRTVKIRTNRGARADMSETVDFAEDNLGRALAFDMAREVAVATTVDLPGESNVVRLPVQFK